MRVKRLVSELVSVYAGAFPVWVKHLVSELVSLYAGVGPALWKGRMRKSHSDEQLRLVSSALPDGVWMGLS